MSGNGYIQTGGGANRKYVHRDIAEKLLGRELRVNEQIHHVDGNKTNNTPSNLFILSPQDHTRLHAAMRKDKGLDQKKWLLRNYIPFEDLSHYAQSSE